MLQQQASQVKVETFLRTRSTKGYPGDSKQTQELSNIRFQVLEGHSRGAEESKAVYIPNTTNVAWENMLNKPS